MKNNTLLDYINGNAKLRDLAEVYGVRSSNVYPKAFNELVKLYKEDQETIESLCKELDKKDKENDKRFNKIPKIIRWIWK